MYRKFLFLLLAIAILSVHASAQATTTQCTSVSVPAGWVSVSYSTNSGCGVGTNNQRTIEQISTLSTGASVGACNDGLPIPSGWVITGFPASSVCGSNTAESLFNINGESSGFSVNNVCFQSTIPAFWVITDTPTISACGSGTGTGRNILNVANLPTGIQETVCRISTVPSGWSVISTGSNSTCGGSSGSGYEVIQNNNVPPPQPIHATMQSDGNFVVFNSSGSAVFSTGTAGTGAVIIRVQDDGNLVLYKFIWQAGTYATPAPGPFPPQTCKIGTLLHAPQFMFGGQCIVSPSGQYMFYVDPSGLTFIYDIAHSTGTWAAPGTGGNAGDYVLLQTNGNLVVYNSAGTIGLWNSVTTGSGADLLNMENDGRIILYAPVWNAGTSRGWDTNSYPHPACDVGPGTGSTGVLGVGQCFVSPNGRYELLMQDNDHVVLYDQSVSPPAILWTS
ncbi:MAG: hypothetical protein LAO76_08320 [Acidobacteriia bacterium]|nr:hypothetical protein [Terriglobia bacterium]